MSSTTREQYGAQQTERAGTADAPPRDELDDLFDYDVDLGDVFGEIDTNMDVLVKQPSSSRAGAKENGAGLGIDEEIKIAKKRRPVVKLDETRLLSQAGIPKLRRLARERLKFKGKGHEYTDVARLLNFYQLWLDDLFPRAKFADGLAIIEKLGHTKRMQTMRREWINEGKPRDRFADDTAVSGQDAKQQQQEQQQRSSKTAEESFEPPNIDPAPQSSSPNTGGHQGPDSVSSLPAQGGPKGLQRDARGSESLFVSDDEGTDQPPEDDLDALLAEDAQKDTMMDSGRDGTAIIQQAGTTDNFDDEMEAMAGMQDMW